MTKKIAIIFLFIAGPSLSAQIPLDSIRAIISKEVAHKRSKSIIVGIIDSTGRRIVSAGIRSDTNPVAPDGNTIYEIGSITKVYTSLLLADMALNNKLNLTDPISRYLPATVKTPKWNEKEISLLHLSSNRSGLPRNAYNVDARYLDNPFADYRTADLYEFISNISLNRDIDSRWQYSNIGYSLLGHILSLVGQQHFDTLVLENICKPLQLNSTSFSVPPMLRSNMAAGYSECGIPASAWDFPLAGGGGLRSSVNDQLTFAAANLGLVPTELFPAMELSHIKRGKKDGNDGYVTMGWSLWNDNGQHILFKDGGTGGYRTFIGMDKKNQFGVVVLSNCNNSITDIGLHILDSNYKVQAYQYPWALLDTLRTTLQRQGLAAAGKLYSQLKTGKPPGFLFDDRQLNHLGNELARAKKTKEAMKIFKLNVQEYPRSTLAYESLGEFYRRTGKKKKAVVCFEKLVVMEPENLHWAYVIKKVKDGFKE